LGIVPIALCASGMPHTVGKLSTRATTLLHTSPQLVCTQSYGIPKLWESQFWEIWNSHLRDLKQNDIWLLALLSTKNIIRGKLMASPKSMGGSPLTCFHPWTINQLFIIDYLINNYSCNNILFIYLFMNYSSKIYN